MKRGLKTILLATSSALTLNACNNSNRVDYRPVYQYDTIGIRPISKTITKIDPAKLENIAGRLSDKNINAPDSLEKIAKDIDPNIRICVIPQGEWANIITHKTEFNTAYYEDLGKQIPEAALKRMRYYFPEANQDKKLDSALISIMEKTKEMNNSTTATAYDSDGKRYEVVIIGSTHQTRKEFFDFYLQGDADLSDIANKNTNIDVLKYYDLAVKYHELGHAFDVKSDSLRYKAEYVKDPLYLRHVEEMHGCAFAEIKLLQLTGDLKQTQLHCDLRMLSGLYDANTISFSSIAYFNHKLFDNIKQAYNQAEDGFKDLSDAQLLKISQKIADESIYSHKEFESIQKSFITVGNKLCTMHQKDRHGNIEDVVDEKAMKGLVGKATKKGLLNKTHPYVIKLEEAEQRTFGLSKNRALY